MSESLGEIRVLHVEDDPGFADVTATVLEDTESAFDIESAPDPSQARQILENQSVDCIVSDYDMPEMNGIEFLELVREEWGDIPFILFTGKGSEEIASDAISAGVTDYLQKGGGTSQYEVLANRIRNAVQQRQAELKARTTKNRLHTIAEHSNEVLWLVTSDWDELLFVNSRYEEIWGQSIAEIRDHPPAFREGIHPEDLPDVDAAMERASAGEFVDIEFRVNPTEDYDRWVWTQGKGIGSTGDEIQQIVGFARDITERKAREQERKRMLDFLQSLSDIATDQQLEPKQKIQLFLDAGPEKLGLPYGHLTRIETDGVGGGTQTVIEATGNHELLQPGDSCPLEQTYCQRTIATDDVVTIENCQTSDYIVPEAYETFNLGCYIGAKIHVNGELYGTLFFASTSSREEPFSDAEKTFVRLMSKWIGYELERSSVGELADTGD